MQHMYQHDQQWYDPLHIIMWPYWFIDLDLTCSSRLHRSMAPSLYSSIPPRGPVLQSLRLALHFCNRSIKPSLILIFSTLVTWLHVMSHMQWAPSLHIHLWTNLLCISYLNTLVHLGCHSITKSNKDLSLALVLGGWSAGLECQTLLLLVFLLQNFFTVTKRCCTNLVHTIGHHKNLPTSEVAQWYK